MVRDQFLISCKTEGTINYSAVYITLMILCLKAGIVEPKEKAVARHQLSKYIPAAINTNTTIGELLDVVFSTSTSRLPLTWCHSPQDHTINLTQLYSVFSKLHKTDKPYLMELQWHLRVIVQTYCRRDGISISEHYEVRCILKDHFYPQEVHLALSVSVRMTQYVQTV
jgi:hypothetical protein